MSGLIQFLLGIAENVFVMINVVAFLVALVDKIAGGGLNKVFWFMAKWFGALGITIGCILFRHRTKNCEVFKTALYAAIHLLILWLLDKILMLMQSGFQWVADKIF